MTFAGFMIPWGPIVQAERERRRLIDAFTTGGGFKLNGGGPRQQEWLMKEIKNAMLRSRSFSALMFEIRADAQHPVEIRLSKDQPDVFVDGFSSSLQLGAQEIDIGDLAKIPIDPPRGFPHAVTRREVLVHAMAEARAGALGIEGGRDEYAHAHNAANDAQNVYRDEQGLQGHRRPHPHDGGYNAAGNWEMRYDNGYWEVWVKGDTPKSIGEITRSRNQGAPQYDANERRKDMEGLVEPLNQQRR